jgi:hypothetical protein
MTAEHSNRVRSRGAIHTVVLALGKRIAVPHRMRSLHEQQDRYRQLEDAATLTTSWPANLN